MPPVQSPDPTPPARSPDLTPRRAAITGFVVFQLFAVLVTALPPTTRLVAVGKAVVEPYVHVVGLAQSWPMFSPNPPRADGYVQAHVIYRDGRTTEWKFPIPADYGYFRRYTIERFRKWGNDHIRPNDGGHLWPDAARYVARVTDTRGVPPDTVKLSRYWTIISPLDSGPPKTPPELHTHQFFVYPVKPADLR